MQEYPIEPFLYPDNSRQQINTHKLSDLLQHRSHQLYQPHKTSFYVIQLFEEGEGQHTVDFSTISIQERSILFMTPDHIKQFHKADYHARVLIFTEGFFCRNDIQSQFIGHTSLFNDPLKLAYFNLDNTFSEVSTLFNLISEELKKKYSIEQTQILNNYLYNILLLCNNKLSNEVTALDSHPGKLLIARFKSLVKQNLRKNYTINKYAAELGVSIRTLQKSFVQEEGISPGDWLDNRLILESKRKLMNRERSISEIAYSIGFKELTHFTKFFKSKTGMTPSEFRKKETAVF